MENRIWLLIAYGELLEPFLKSFLNDGSCDKYWNMAYELNWIRDCEANSLYDISNSSDDDEEITIVGNDEDNDPSTVIFH